MNEVESIKTVVPGGARFSLLARAHNEGAAVRAFWESVQQQNIIDEGEVIFLLDGSSCDGTLQYLLGLNCSIYRIPPGTFNYGKSCNQLFSMANTSILLNFSSHVVLSDPNAIEKAVQFLEGRRKAAVYFRQVPNPVLGVNSYEKAFLAWHFPNKSDIEELKTPGSFSNAGAGYTKDAWQDLPFREIHGAEDADWAKRHLEEGGSLFYMPQVEIQHSHNYSSATLYRRTRTLVEANHATGSYLKFLVILVGVYFAMVRQGSSLREAAEYSWAHASAYL